MSISHDTRNPSRASTSPPTAPARRGFLAILTGAAAAGPAIALAAATEPPAPITGPVVEEAPELLELGDQLTAAMGELKAALAKKAEAVALFEQTKPAVPEEIIWRASKDGAGRHLVPLDRDLAPEERDLDGNVVYLNDGLSRRIYESKRVRAEIILKESSARTKDGKRLRSISRLAKKYESDLRAATKACGYVDREREVYQATRRALDTIDRLAELVNARPVGAKGLLIYAQALAATPRIHEAKGNGVHWGCGERHFADVIADGLLRITQRLG